MVQAGVGVFFAPTDQDLVYFYKTICDHWFSVNCMEDKSQEDQGKSEVGGVVTLKNSTTIDLTVTTAPDMMSLYNTDD